MQLRDMRTSGKEAPVSVLPVLWEDILPQATSLVENWYVAERDQLAFADEAPRSLGAFVLDWRRCGCV
jgi:hypothetical protein